MCCIAPGIRPGDSVMSLNMRVVAMFTDGKLSELALELKDAATINSFQQLLNRALNTWEDAPADWKELSDKMEHGKVLQNYTKHVNSGTRAVQETPLPPLPEPLPVCSSCGQLGYGHMFNCPVLLKK